MRTVNSVTLMGNIARAPEKRVTIGGKVFATFVIATHKESVKNGERSTNSEFHNIVAWGNLANIAENFCKQGGLVYLEGYLKTRSWNHENGAKIFRTEIVATNIISLNNNETEEDPSLYQKNSRDTKEKDDFFDIKEDESFFNASPDDFFEN
jgi:single-strand DNA-binding protein